MLTLYLYIVANGLLYSLEDRDEDILDSLRDCIYNLIPLQARLNMYSGGDSPSKEGLKIGFATVTDLSLQEYANLSNKATEIFPTEIVLVKWSTKRKVMVYFRTSKMM